jgi:hypothetical protein
MSYLIACAVRKIGVETEILVYWGQRRTVTAPAWVGREEAFNFESYDVAKGIKNTIFHGRDDIYIMDYYTGDRIDEKNPPQNPKDWDIVKKLIRLEGLRSFMREVWEIMRDDDVIEACAMHELNYMARKGELDGNDDKT